MSNASSVQLFNSPVPQPPTEPLPPPSLLAVIWSQRLVVGITTLAVLLAAAIYLAFTPPTHRARASIALDATGARRLAESREGPVSENYNQTRADEIRSLPILRRALVNATEFATRTLSETDGELATRLQDDDALVVVPERRSDVISVTFDSRYADEAVAIVRAIVSAYVADATERNETIGEEVLKQLDAQRVAISEQRRVCQAELAEHMRKAGMSGEGDVGDDVRRAATLAASLTTIETRLVELKSQRKALADAMNDPTALSGIVESMQYRAQDFGDAEYNQLRQQLAAVELSLTSARTVQGEQHSSVRILQQVVAETRERIAKKEASIAQSRLRSLETDIASAEASIAEMRGLVGSQGTAAAQKMPLAGRVQELRSELLRLDRHLEAVERRATEISLSSTLGVSMTTRVLEPAHLLPDPVHPKTGITLAIAILTGVLAGTGLALLRETQFARMRTPTDIPGVPSSPLLVSVPHTTFGRSLQARGLLMRLDPYGEAAEAFRSLRTILCLGAARPFRTLCITSPARGDGKSMTASNLATAFAEAGDRTLLIDADLRCPVQHTVFGLNPRLGLGGVLLGKTRLRNAVQATATRGLYVMPAATGSASPNELFNRRRFGCLLRALSLRFDRIIIDTPPVNLTSESVTLASAADAALMVVRVNRSNRQSFCNAISVLQRVRANLVGVVANDVRHTFASGHPYGSYGYDRPQEVPRLNGSVKASIGDGRSDADGSMSVSGTGGSNGSHAG